MNVTHIFVRMVEGGYVGSAYWIETENEQASSICGKVKSIMSLKLCCAEFMVSDSNGTGFANSWLPQPLTEAMLASTKDGTVDDSPDQVPFIDGGLTWENTSDDPIYLFMMIRRASRSLITSDPNKVVLDDAWAWDMGLSPNAAVPYAAYNGIGIWGKMSPSTHPILQYAHYFADRADWVSYEQIGACQPGWTLQFNYRALFSTPGTWRTAITPKHECWARYAQLRLFGKPYLTGDVV